jgi:transcriptional regulator with XRE-family HTH domain
MSLGEKIRSLRRRRGLTVQGLASACSLSKGFISQVENGRTSPSLSTLCDLAKVLGVSPAFLVANGLPGAHVTRANGRSSVAAEIRGAQATSLSDRPQRTLDLYLVELAPGASIAGEPLDEPGEQAAHVLCGFVRLGMGENQLDLGPGDTGHWNECPKMSVTNLGAETARLMLAMLSVSSLVARGGEG